MDITITKRAAIEAGTSSGPGTGGVRVKGEADLEVDQIVGTLMLELFSVDSVVRIEALPADIERAGKIVEALRHKVGDLRNVCVEHGYYESKRPHYDCPTCGENAKPVAIEAVGADVEF